MDYFEAMADIKAKYPALNDNDLRTAFDSEIKHEEGMSSGRGKYQRAVDTAHDRILAWIGSAGDYKFEMTYESLAHFVGSHRKACAWAVLIGRDLKGML